MRLSTNQHVDRNAQISPVLWLYLPVGFAILLLIISQLAPAFYERWMESEQGVIEIIHILIPSASFVLAIQCFCMKQVKLFPLYRAWLGLFAFGSLYIAGEEMSWGQHFLHWGTSEFWSSLNQQKETNLHNVSSWFDQKPRLLLRLGIIVGGIILPIYALFKPIPVRKSWLFFLPAGISFVTAFLSEIIYFSEKIVEVLEIPYFLFYRASEVQETYLYWFILLYLLVLKGRIRQLDKEEDLA